MNTRPSASVLEHLKRIGRSAECVELVEVLRAELEETKALLVKADVENFRRLQGYAQALQEVVALVTSKKA